MGIGAVLCASLLWFTTSKIATMLQLRGDDPGIAPRTMVLTRELRRFNPAQAEYELRDPAGTRWTIQLTATQMYDRRYGDTMRVRCLDDERECFIRDSVFVNDGNLSFDHTLQIIDIVGLLACLAAMARRVVRWRRAKQVFAPPMPSS